MIINITQEQKEINKREENKHFFSTDLETKSEINFLPTKDKRLKSILVANLIFCLKYDKTLYVYRKKTNIQYRYDFAYEPFIQCLNWLVAEKYVEQKIGQFFGDNSKLNSLTKIVPTDKLKELLKSENINEGYFWNIKKNKRTVEFDLTDKELKSYLKKNVKDQQELKGLRDKLLLLNTIYNTTSISLSSRIGPMNEKSSTDIDGFSDSNLPQNLVQKGNFKMIFEKTIHEHGRLYHPFQNYKSIDRLNWKMNGEEVVEIDFSATHPQIIYHELGLPLPPNAYEVTSYSRSEAKLAMMMMINCGSRIAALEAIKNEDPSIIDPNELMKQLEQIHKPILHKLYKGNYKLMNMDARIALDICYELAKKNIPCYPIHDSFIVPVSNKNDLEQQMVLSWQKILKTNYIPKFDQLTKEKAEQKQILKQQKKGTIQCLQNTKENLEAPQEEIKNKEQNQPTNNLPSIQINILNNGKNKMECHFGESIQSMENMNQMISQDLETEEQRGFIKPPPNKNHEIEKRLKKIDEMFATIL